MKRFLSSIIIAVLLLTACGQKEVENAKNYPIEDHFSYINQEGNKMGLEDLKGKVWVADFIFTNCETVCLPMTSSMAKLQKMVKDEKINNIEFVSFSVDPEIDSPEALKNYGKKFDADFGNWNFLTGYSQEEIEKFAAKNFKMIVKKPENDDQVIHGTYFCLVDKNGTMVKYYSGLSDVPFQEIINDIKILQQ